MLHRIPLPSAICFAADITPFLSYKWGAETLLNKVLQENIDDGDVDFLYQHTVKIVLDGSRSCWILSFDKHRINLTKAKPDVIADVTISAGPYEFLLMLSRKEDPDTLFFQRRMRISGGTELGLTVKNLLDSIDLEQMPSAMHHAIDHAERIMRRFKPAEDTLQEAH